MKNKATVRRDNACSYKIRVSISRSEILREDELKVRSLSLSPGDLMAPRKYLLIS